MERGVSLYETSDLPSRIFRQDRAETEANRTPCNQALTRSWKCALMACGEIHPSDSPEMRPRISSMPSRGVKGINDKYYEEYLHIPL